MKQPQVFIPLFFIGLILSGINPKEYFTWFLEVSPAIIGLLILVFTYKKFQFTNFTYFFILIHCYILFLGGHYTYAEVPPFEWIKETFNQSRNNYDKVGHFAQGFVPAMITRELFIRGDAFLGTQGYVWDTQSDMLYATIGAICMLIIFSNKHDKAIQKQIQ